MDVTTSTINYRYYSNDWFSDWDGEWPLFGANLDSVMLNTVRVDVVKSNDADFHITKVKFSRGINPVVARNLAEKISFEPIQKDSLVLLPKGFSISQREKFRNQQILLILQVPIGKRFFLDKSINRYDWFDVRYNRRGGFEIEDTWERTYWVETGREYVMTPDGPKQVSKLDPEALKRGEYKELKDDEERQDNNERENQPQAVPAPGKDSTGGYRYRPRNNSDKKEDSTPAKNRSAAADDHDEEEKTGLFTTSLSGNEVSAPLNALMRLIQ